MQHLPRTAQKFFCMGALWWITACPRAATPVLVAPPQDTGALGPTLVAVEGDVARFPLQANANACKSCHAEQAEGWRKSMHAFSSFNNPFYRFNFDAYVQEKGHSKGPFCAGCHDPNPLLASELGQPVQPDAPHAHAGIGCVVCHLTQKASPNGNGSYVLKSESLLIPKAGDDASVQAHRAQMDGPRRLGNALCVSCHRGFLSRETGHDLFIPALEDWVPFRHSGYHAQKATRVDAPSPPHQCITCHMPPQENTDGKVTHDHASAGGHTAFSRLADDKIQTQKNEQLLQSGAKLFIPVVGFDEEPGVSFQRSLIWRDATQIYFDAVVFNAGTGHHFPGGARDLKDTWLEVRVTDASGKLVAENGLAHEKEHLDDEAHRFGVLQVDHKGLPILEHRVAHFRTAAFDHTVGPRDARVVRYALNLKQHPHLQNQNLNVTVRLRHRRLNPTFYTASCRASQRERGQKFLAFTKDTTGVRLEPCKPQPILELHQISFEWITAGEPKNRALSVEALWAHGLGMLHALNEKIYLARHSFDLATQMAQGRNQKDQWEHRLNWAQATVLAHQGRTRDAVARFDAGLIKQPNHPALLYGAAKSLVRTWRFQAALPYLQAARKAAPEDTRIAVDLARAHTSQGRYRAALQVVQEALKLHPRNSNLLRLQWIAVDHLEPKSETAQKARQTFLKYKRDEMAPAIQGVCQDKNEFCKRERLGVHTHWLSVRSEHSNPEPLTPPKRSPH